ncbi:MAG: carboxypeptidase-like regulatory domain-containing protein [Flavobacteriales bacterium]|nr:carboxypeptidase-like regulatory domain-containing protein [Flavobacteriales bacterium]
MPKRNVHLLILFTLLILSFKICAQVELTVHGMVIDNSNDSPLPFATISVKGSLYGVTSDKDGYFKMTLPKEEITETLLINYIGFQPFELEVQEALVHENFRLEPMTYSLHEVIVRPQSAETYLKKVVKELRSNYAHFSFNTLAHYEEVINENTYPIDHSEAVFRSWFQDFQEEGRSDHQLILFREKETNELQFMRAKAEKEKEKYLSKNPEKADQYDENDILLTNFGGPSSILNLNVVNGSLDCLDTNSFRKFKFNYLPETSYEGNRLIVISYESKGAVEHRKQRGKLFIDSNNDAIVKIEEEGELIIPAIAKPILFIMGLRLRKPTYKFTLKYRSINNRWYPQYSKWNVQIDMTKKHTLKKNENSSFDIQQHYIVSSIGTENVRRIQEDKVFDPSKKMETQVFPINGVDWYSIER